MKIMLILLNRSVKIIDLCGFNPVQDGHFRGCSLMGYPKKAPPPQNLSHISYNDETWHRYTLPKEDFKKVSIT